MRDNLKILPINLIKSILYLLFFLVLLFFSPNLTAKVTCTGQACTIIPERFTSQFDSIDSTFKSQYLQPVLESMIESSVIANNNSGMIGVGYINRFQIGGGIGGGYVSKDDITLRYQDMTIPKLPNVGIAATPSVMVGFNLGWILGRGPSLVEKPEKENDSENEEEEEEEERSILHRFNFYFHGMKANYYTKDLNAAYGKKPELNGGIATENFGVMVRYQLIEPKISDFSLIGFSGVSVGLGYNMLNLNLDMHHQAKTNSTVHFGEYQGAWIAKTDFEFASNVRSIPLEVRTGIKLLYFFDFFCGVGISKNTGTADLHLSRGGPIKLSLDPYYVYNTTLLTSDYYKYYSNNALNPGNGTLNPEGTLSLDVRNKKKINYNTNYAIVGIEINLLFLKLLAEGTILEKSYGANIGLKIAF